MVHRNIFGVGEITIRASQDNRWLQLDIEDNAGLYRANPQASGLGMNLADRRLRARFGADCGISVTCEPERFTASPYALPWRRMHAESIDRR